MLIKMNCRTDLSRVHNPSSSLRLDTSWKVRYLCYYLLKRHESHFCLPPPPRLHQVLVCVTAQTLFHLNCGRLTVTQVTSARKHMFESQPHPPCGHSLIPSSEPPSDPPHCFLRSFTLRHANFQPAYSGLRSVKTTRPLESRSTEGDSSERKCEENNHTKPNPVKHGMRIDVSCSAHCVLSGKGCGFFQGSKRKV